MRLCVISLKIARSIPDGIIASGVDSSFESTRYQGYSLGVKGGWWVGLTNLGPSCVEILEFLGFRCPENVMACPGL